MMLASSEEMATSDEVLAERARKGSRGAFIVLVARYRDRIYRLALRMSRNVGDAEEITQEAFLRAHTGIGSFRSDSRFGTWLYRIAMNESLMRQRSARRRPLESLEVAMPGFGDAGMPGDGPQELAEDLIDSKTLASRVRTALEQLDEDHRAALVLRDLEELPADEVAEVLGVSPDVVRQRAHRARLKLRGLLAPFVSHSSRASSQLRSVAGTMSRRP